MSGITQSGGKHAWLRVFAIGAVLAALVIAPPMGWAQQSEERLALLIGNAGYSDASTPLISTKDAHALAEELRRYRFKVDLKENLGKVNMSAALATFVEKIGPGTVALFYFGGYGLQLGKQTYLLPVNAQIWSEPDIAREGTRLEEVLANLHRKGASIKIVIIDGARRNAYERRARRVAMGLAAARAPDNTLIMYSTGPDKLVNENNAPWALTSLFMNELIKELRVPNARAEEVFDRVRRGVSQASLMEQIPWVLSSLVSPFSFSSAGPISPQAPPPRPTPPQPPPSAPSPPPSTAEKPLSSERESALKPHDTFKECASCPEMVVIPAGEFRMGSPETEPERSPEEGPQHAVQIARPFAVGKFAVTRDEFEAFVRETNYSSDRCWTLEDGREEERLGRSFRNPGFTQGGNHPAVCVSWDDAGAYVTWLSRKTGKAYRLLTEAEWEYVARAGTSTRYFFGEDEQELCRYGNGLDQTAEKNSIGDADSRFLPCSDGFAYTAPVGSFLPNAFSLYDMHGNAFEWVEDCWNNNYRDAPSDGAASLMGDCSRRVRRGGAWNYVASRLRSAFRSSRQGFGRYSNTGLRVARILNR